MGKDKPPKEPPNKEKGAPTSKNADEKPSGGRGHKQRGAGTVIVARPNITTNDGVVLKPHERLPSTLLHEYCQREKRPAPKYATNPPGIRMTAILEDAKNSKNDLRFSPVQAAESSAIARDFAALLALFHFQKTLPLERRLPEPYSTTWTELIKASKPGSESPTPATAPPPAPVITKKSSGSATDVPPPPPYQKPSATVVVPVLDKNTADWLCHACGNQNFAKTASGIPRTKCFRCQTPKSENCTLVASVTASTAVTTTTTADGKAQKKAPQAIVDLRAENKFVSKSEAEQHRLQLRTQRNQRLTFFDALKRANRPKTIHLTTELRNTFEQLLGLSSLKSSFANNSQYASILEEVEEEGILSSEVCEIEYYEQANALKEMFAKLQSEGYSENQLILTVKSLFSASSTLEEEYLMEVSKTDSSSQGMVFSSLIENYLKSSLTLKMNEEENETEESTTKLVSSSSNNQIGGAYFGYLVEQLNRCGWLKMDSVNIENLIELLAHENIQNEKEAKALEIMMHYVFLLSLSTTNNEMKKEILSLLQLIFEKDSSQEVHELENQIEEEIVVLESIYPSLFQSSMVEINSQSFYLFVLSFENPFTIFRTSCEVHLQILIPQHINYPVNIPFANVSLLKPVMNPKLSTVFLEINHQLAEKVISLKGNLVTFELYSWVQEKMNELADQSFMKSNKNLVKNAEIQEIVELLKEKKYDIILSPSEEELAVTKPQPQQQLSHQTDAIPDEEDTSTVVTKTTSESTTTAKSQFKGGFWDRSKKNNFHQQQPAPTEVFPSRTSLPAWNCKDSFLSSLQSNRAIIVTGETGCG
jgi:hypothetical protein